MHDAWLVEMNMTMKKDNLSQPPVGSKEDRMQLA